MAYYTEIECDAFDPFYHTEEQLRSDVNTGSFESLVEHVSKGDIDTSLVKIIVIDEMDYILLSKAYLSPRRVELVFRSTIVSSVNTSFSVTESSTDGKDSPASKEAVGRVAGEVGSGSSIKQVVLVMERMKNVVIIQVLFFLVTTTYACSKQEREALLGFTHNLYSMNYTFNDECGSSYYTTMTIDWNTSTDCCNWNGVTCNLSGDVIRLILGCGKLQVERLKVFPNSFRAMKQLERLDLSNNEIHGQIPHWAGEIGGTDGLRYLNLSHNFITGLPQFKCYGLYQLYLRSNLIQGPFPPSICNMSSLMYLDISNNRFGGLIPQCFRNITSPLVMIDMGNNRFQGTIPSFIYCYGDNYLGSYFKRKSVRRRGATLMSQIQSLVVVDFETTLEWLNLPCSMKNVDISSTAPTYVYIGGLYYSFNVVMKGVDRDIPRLFVGLTIIDLSNNFFERGIPEIIGNLNSLKENPQSLAGIKGLAVLDLSQNHLVGRIPEGTQFNTFDESSFAGNLGLCGFPLPKKCSERTHKPQLEEHENHGEKNGFTWEVVTLGYGCGTYSDGDG
ncbi:leucine-rich repeat-containing protein [Tanacetum coccineum]